MSVEPPFRVPMARRGLGTKGQRISLLSNHFKVTVGRTDCSFYQYSVAIKYEDDKPVDAKGIGRKILQKLQETYSTELAGMDFAYDGEKTLFTIGPLPQTKLDFTVVLEERPANRSGGDGSSPSDGDRKRLRKPSRLKTYTVAINYATKIPIKAIANAIRGQDSEQFQEAVRVMDIILRQHASKQGCLLVRQSFFHNDVRNFVSLGGGINACRGFHASFRATQGGLCLNMDVSTTMIVKPGPVIDFLLENQNVREPTMINWEKAKRTLKNLRVKAVNTNLEYKIRGLSDRTCREQTFSMRERTGSNEGREVELTVYDYFVHKRNVQLQYSRDLPCIDVGKPKKPTYIPLELCILVSLQRYTKAMTNLQRAALVEKSRQKPQERMNVLNQAFTSSKYEADPLLGSAGVSISREFTKVQGRVLQAPQLKVGNGDNIMPSNGRWNFNNKRLIEPFHLQRWAIANFSARCDMNRFSSELIRSAERKGMRIEAPYRMFEENPQFRRYTAPDRVEEMAAMIMKGLPGRPQILICILPERKNSDIYGPLKRKNLSELGIVTQCISPPQRGFNDQYCTNLLLKINSKLGGINSLLGIEHSSQIPMVSKVPTIIIGMDVSHGSPGRSDVPSIAAVVNSRQWPLISRYRASVRTQPPKMEMIDNLFKVVGNKDEGIFSEILLDYYISSKHLKPDHIIIFRDGVSESQFNQVLNIELQQMIEACKFQDPTWNPKFTLIVAQKNHHTKFFQPNNPNNVPPGTVVDNGVCHPKNYDFYMCSQAGPIGTTRPTHYHVLYDEIGFSPDDLQALVHSLSYVYQRSTTAISVVAPICYAHLAAAQVSQFIKFDEFSDRSSSQGGGDGSGTSVPQLPKLHDNVSSSMFFC